MFIHLSTDEHLGYFHILTTVNSAAMNICVQVFVWVAVVNSLGNISKSGIAETYGISFFFFFIN